MADAAPRRPSLAIHVAAELARRADGGWWPRGLATRDTVVRAARLGASLGFDRHETLTGEHATVEALTDALRVAATTVAPHGCLMLTFSGHTDRGAGPVPDARWCLFDGGIALSTIAGALATLPTETRVLIVGDTCYGAAIARVLCGPQRAVVVAACRDDQCMVDRRRSEFLVRTETLVRSRAGDVELEELRDALESDTPDCERPVVWTNAERRLIRAGPLVAVSGGGSPARTPPAAPRTPSVRVGERRGAGGGARP